MIGQAPLYAGVKLPSSRDLRLLASQWLTKVAPLTRPLLTGFDPWSSRLRGSGRSARTGERLVRHQVADDLDLDGDPINLAGQGDVWLFGEVDLDGVSMIYPRNANT